MTVKPIADRQQNTPQKQTDAQFIDHSTQPKQDVGPPQQKKWTTFLQRPKNVKPLCKKQEEERKILGEPYRVKIVKQPKRDPKEKKIVHFKPEVIELENRSETLLKEASEVTEIVNIDDESSDVEVQATIGVEEETYVEVDEEDSGKNLEVDDEIKEIMKNYEDDDEYYPDNDDELDEVRRGVEKVHEHSVIKIPKPILKVKPMTNGNLPDNPMSLEEQLAAVQKQLLALSQLPSAIQSTLEAVTKQLNEIVSLKNSSESSNEENPAVDEFECRSDESQIDLDEVLDENNNSVSENAEADITENDAEDQQFEELPSEHIANGEEHGDTREGRRETTPPPRELTEEEREAIRKEGELLAKKQKAMEERKKKDWIERPIVLPGGRKWNGPDDTVPKFRNPKMSDEKIGQMIEPFSEVIVGKTKGETNCHLVGKIPVEGNQLSQVSATAEKLSLSAKLRSLQANPWHGTADKRVGI